MTSQLITMLPHYVVNHIKLYTGEAVWRRGKFIHIHRIPLDDPRYRMLLRKPKIKQLSNNFNLEVPKRGTTWFKLPNNKFMVINVQHVYAINGVRYDTFIWEMYYDQKKISVALR